jgi:hypothetical protein
MVRRLAYTLQPVLPPSCWYAFLLFEIESDPMNAMKALALAGLLTTATLATSWAAGPMAAAPASASNVVTGEVLEVKGVEVYTYLRLKTAQGEVWAAVNKAPVVKGAKVTLTNVMTMENFESKELKKTFPTILFASLEGAGPAAGTGAAAADPHAGMTKAPAEAIDVKVAKATGANAVTVAEVVSKADKLKDKPVRVQGKVVKYNAGIMGKNWIHLRDGSGSAADSSNDILVTTDATAKVGDVITASGVVHTNKDFGAGYSYKVLIEEATLKP